MIKSVIMVLSKIGLKLVELYIVFLFLIIFGCGIWKILELINSAKFKKCL